MLRIQVKVTGARSVDSAMASLSAMLFLSMKKEMMMTSLTVTTKVPPSYDGRSSWFAYGDAIDVWCDITESDGDKRGPALRNRLEGEAAMKKRLLDRDRLKDPNNGVKYFKSFQRPLFVKGAANVFLYRFQQFKNLHSGNGDMLRWITRFQLQLSVQRMQEVLNDTYPPITDSNSAEVRGFVAGHPAAEEQEGLTNEEATERANERLRDQHARTLPITANLVALIFVSLSNLTRDQRQVYLICCSSSASTFRNRKMLFTGKILHIQVYSPFWFDGFPPNTIYVVLAEARPYRPSYEGAQTLAGGSHDFTVVLTPEEHAEYLRRLHSGPGPGSTVSSSTPSAYLASVPSACASPPIGSSASLRPKQASVEGLLQQMSEVEPSKSAARSPMPTPVTSPSTSLPEVGPGALEFVVVLSPEEHKEYLQRRGQQPIAGQGFSPPARTKPGAAASPKVDTGVRAKKGKQASVAGLLQQMAESLP
ncbi:hypothetical protein AK812_SmicGene11858 [Symbiodinium microadriaticum]|uniref:Uncharacterized protein n=1 Tax=Symbiodinium microadriaticum TaxID=2951 RepID=A0A1Q9EC40_SYMMI|nr:hypothetical protein AK812_SmicGene11858 [Symbiodinium microadriaticum]